MISYFLIFSLNDRYYGLLMCFHSLYKYMMHFNSISHFLFLTSNKLKIDQGLCVISEAFTIIYGSDRSLEHKPNETDFF